MKKKESVKALVPVGKQGLQKVTGIQKKFDYLMSLEKITVEDLDLLKLSERDQFGVKLNELINNAKGTARDRLFAKIAPIADPESKNQVWEHNHLNIIKKLSLHMREYARMPSQGELATLTGLSRKTINEHLAEYSKHPFHIAQVEQHKIMASHVLSIVYQLAAEGDVRACKLYLEMVGGIGQKEQQVKTQNFIQINGLTISQDQVTNLPPAQLNKLVNLLSGKRVVGKELENEQYA